MTAIAWPIDQITPRHFSPQQASATVRGSASLSGITQRSASDAGRWRIKASQFPVATPANILIWRSLEGQAEGQLGQILLTILDLDRPPLPLYDSGPERWSDGTLFSDGTGWSTSGHAAEVFSDTALGATTMEIEVTAGSLPVAGNLFSVGVRLYKITRIISSTATTVTAKIWPPTREFHAAWAEANFYRPVLLCRLASDDAMALPPLDFGRWVFPDVEFIEDTGPEL